MHPATQRELKNFVPNSQLFFGTDYPFGSVAAHLKGLQKCGFNQTELQGIYRNNAAKFLPKFA